MLPHEAAALAAIRGLYGTEVRYTGEGLTDEPVVAIRTDEPATNYQGLEGRAARTSFEIQFSDLPAEPRKGNIIVEADGSRWSVNDKDPHADVAAWVLTVEEAEQA